MQKAWNAVSEVILELTTDQIISMVVFALFLSVATIGLFRLFDRWKADAKTALIGLLLVSNLIAMLSSSAYLRFSHPQAAKGIPVGRDAGDGNRLTPHGMTSQVIDSLAMQILFNSDSNHDGNVTAEEASEAASRFIQETSARTNHPGQLDGSQLRASIGNRYGPPLLHSPE